MILNFPLCAILVFGFITRIDCQYFDFIQALQPYIQAQPSQTFDFYNDFTTRRTRPKQKSENIRGDSLRVVAEQTDKNKRRIPTKVPAEINYVSTTLKPIRKTTKAPTIQDGSLKSRQDTKIANRPTSGVGSARGRNDSINKDTAVIFFDDDLRNRPGNYGTVSRVPENSNINRDKPIAAIVKTDSKKSPNLPLVAANYESGSNWNGGNAVNYYTTKMPFWDTTKATTQSNRGNNNNYYSTKSPYTEIPKTTQYRNNYQTTRSLHFETTKIYNNQHSRGNSDGYQTRPPYTETTRSYTTQSSRTTRNYQTTKSPYADTTKTYNHQNNYNYYTTHNPLLNRPGVKPPVVNGPPITNKPATQRPDTGHKDTHVTDDGNMLPEIMPGPDEDNMSAVERKRYIDIAERMCDKYKSLNVKQVHAIPLVPSPSPVQVNVTSCTPINVPLVVGGRIVSIQEFPHMTLLGWIKTKNRGYSWKCGGSLLSNQYVLTAGHCSYQDRDDNVIAGPPRVVQLGSSYLNDPKAEIVKVSKVIRHPKFKQPKAYYDLAIVRLVTAVSFSETIKPACLGTPPRVNEHVIATGWGRTEFGGSQSHELRSVSIPVWDLTVCSNALGISMKIPYGPSSDSQICAGERNGGKDTCQGDSGGPAQVQDGCSWRVVAVTSVGRSCGAAETPAIYATVQRAFISAVVFGNQVAENNYRNDNRDYNQGNNHRSDNNQATINNNYNAHKNNRDVTQQTGSNIHRSDNAQATNNNENFNRNNNNRDINHQTAYQVSNNNYNTNKNNRNINQERDYNNHRNDYNQATNINNNYNTNKNNRDVYEATNNNNNYNTDKNNRDATNNRNENNSWNNRNNQQSVNVNTNQQTNNVYQNEWINKQNTQNTNTGRVSHDVIYGNTSNEERSSDWNNNQNSNHNYNNNNDYNSARRETGGDYYNNYSANNNYMNRQSYETGRGYSDSNFNRDGNVWWT